MVAENYRHGQIKRYRKHVHVPEEIRNEVTLIAVSKTKPVAMIRGSHGCRCECIR